MHDKGERGDIEEFNRMCQCKVKVDNRRIVIIINETVKCVTREKCPHLKEKLSDVENVHTLKENMSALCPFKRTGGPEMTDHKMGFMVFFEE